MDRYTRRVQAYRDGSRRRTVGRQRWLRALKWTWRIGVALTVLVVVATWFWLRTALYHSVILFPEDQASRAALRAMRIPTSPLPDWHEYRGVVHSHSELSHDCEVPFPEILRVLKETDTHFICLSDHCDEGKADFSRQWRGLYDGKLFIPGFEMKEGLMPFGVASNVVLENGWDAAQIAQTVVSNSGLLFYAHPEEPRVWDRPELTGMEIYNTHADFKDEGKTVLRRLIPDLLVNQRRYPDQVFQLMFDRPAANLKRWDELNRTRRLTGIGGNDCHQNTGLRLVSTAQGTLRLEDTSPKTLRELKLNLLTRGLARLGFGPLTPNRLLFRAQLDPYARMARHVGTHVLARELSEASVLDALKAGRVFVGFDLLADTSGFQWFAERGSERVLLGGDLPYGPEVRLVARSPLPCRFTVLKDGEEVLRREGRSLEWPPPGPGAYRVEAEVWIRGEWIPWVYANPIWIR